MDIFFNKTWIRFCFISLSPRSTPPIPLFLPPHLFCLPRSLSIWKPPNPDVDVEKNIALLGRGRRCGEEWLPPPQPTPRGHGDPSVVSALAHAQRMGNKTLCVVCLDIPPSAHTTLRMTSFPWVLGVPLASVLANPGIFGASVPFSPGRLLFRGGIQVSCL